MAGFDIGVSGIHAAQQAMDVIGNNIANAATEGYHLQRVDLRPADDRFSNGSMIGQGVSVDGITRMVDRFLDKEIVNQESVLAQISRELDALTTMESAFGELITSGMSTAMDNFYNAMHDLALNPAEVIYQREVLTSAETLTNQLRSLGTTVSDLQDHVYSEAERTIDDINLLAGQIAELNESIVKMQNSGDNPNNVLDQRDKLITQLSRLVGISTKAVDDGSITITVLDTPLVMGKQVSELEVGLVASGSDYNIGISPLGADEFNTTLTGGKLGGLFNLRNDIIKTVSTKLDTLAQSIVNETNKLHVQGVGATGSFTALTGWTMTDQDVSDFVPAVVDGTAYIRVTAADGTITRTSVAVDASSGGDTMTTMAAKFDAITGISSLVTGGKLQITADANCTFDFLPGVLAKPDVSGWAGSGGQGPPDVTVTGVYSGTTDETYTFTVAGSGSVGSGTLVVNVVDSGANSIATINVGTGYVPGSIVEVTEGLKISFDIDGTSPGFMNNAETFDVQALANSDSSGLLAAVGLNCFFSGTNATSIAISDYAATSGSRIAVSRSVEMSDSSNILAMAKLGDTADSNLTALTPKAYYRGLATDIGNHISVAKIRGENANGVWMNLNRQRDEVSGVDMNDEAAKMLLFERMFQGMAKYISTVNQSMTTLMGIIR